MNENVEPTAETLAPDSRQGDAHRASPAEPTSPAPSKAQVRAAYRAARRALSPEARKKAQKLILSKLSHSTAVANAKTILIYAATEHEVNLDDLIVPWTRAGKRVVVPRLTKTPGVMTLWAIRHPDALLTRPGEKVRTPDITQAVPVEPKDIDLALVPGVAFTPTLGRLGQGGGYYDRVLPRLKPGAKTIGVAFDVQIAPSVPMEPHDVVLSAVVTELCVFGDDALLQAMPVPAAAPRVPTAQLAVAEPVSSVELSEESNSAGPTH